MMERRAFLQQPELQILASATLFEAPAFSIVEGEIVPRRRQMIPAERATRMAEILHELIKYADLHPNDLRLQVVRLMARGALGLPDEAGNA